MFTSELTAQPTEPAVRVPELSQAALEGREKPYCLAALLSETEALPSAAHFTHVAGSGGKKNSEVAAARYLRDLSFRSLSRAGMETGGIGKVRQMIVSPTPSFVPFQSATRLRQGLPTDAELQTVAYRPIYHLKAPRRRFEEEALPGVCRGVVRLAPPAHYQHEKQRRESLE